MNKQIELSLEKARELYGKNPEMDELLLANFTKDELTKKKLPKFFNELKNTDGYYITSQAKIERSVYGLYLNSFPTEKQAKSALAMAQLSQLMAVYNDGWEPNWRNENEEKYVIYAENSKIISIYTFKCNNQFLAFKIAELRDKFAKNFELLIKEYFMLD